MEDAYKQFDGAFQAFAYWCGYSIARAKDKNLREIAAANELFNLMSADLRDSEKIFSEASYTLLMNGSPFHVKSLDKKPLRNDQYLDILIYEKIGKDKAKPIHCFEIKRFKAGIRAIEADIEKMNGVNVSKKLSRWVIVFGKQDICDKPFATWIKSGKNGNIIAAGKRRILKTKNGCEYTVRRLYRASDVAKKNSAGNANFVAILQIV